LVLQECLFLGSLDAARDWGHARDYVEITVAHAAAGRADDYVIATGHQYPVREFVNAAAEDLGMELTWRGVGPEEKAFDLHGRCVVAVDPHYFRPAEVDTLMGDSSKASRKLGWKAKTTFRELVAEMVAADLESAQKDLLVHNSGYRVHSQFD
jgi:GDPmannose 4,6-dehydratase